VLEETKPSGCGLNGLDPAVESFRRTVADGGCEPGQNPIQAILQHSCDFFDGLEARTDGPGVPGVKELPTSNRIGLVPEVSKQFLQAPRSPGCQSALPKFRQLFILFTAQILRIEQQRLPHPLEPVVSGLLQLSMFQTTNLVDSLIQILRNMKSVMHDQCFWNIRLCAGLVGLPHVHADSLNLLPLRLRQCTPQLIG